MILYLNQRIINNNIIKTMIEANELRINNLLYFNGAHKEIGKVTGISTYVSGHCNINMNNRVDITYSLNELKPIPLTEEILVKLGFENELDEIDGEGYNIYFVTNTDYLIEYFYKRKEFVFTDDMGLKIPISNVHNLQNLYFILTGQELEINL